MTAAEAEMVRKAVTGDLGWTPPIPLEALAAALKEDAGGPGLEPMRAAVFASPDIEDTVREFAEVATQRGFCIS